MRWPEAGLARGRFALARCCIAVLGLLLVSVRAVAAEPVLTPDAASAAPTNPSETRLSAPHPVSTQAPADESPATQATAAMPTTAMPAASEAIDPARLPLRWHVWRLFDPYVSRRETQLSFGLDELREIDGRAPQPGFSLAFGETITTLRPHLWVNLEQKLLFRSSQRSTYALELSKYQYLAGVRLLGLELGGGVGLTPLGVDLSKGEWSLSALSPNVVARAGFKLGIVRLSLDGFSQYQWRWLGRPDARIQGFELQLALEHPRVLKRRNHPLILIY